LGNKGSNFGQNVSGSWVFNLKFPGGGGAWGPMDLIGPYTVIAGTQKAPKCEMLFPANVLGPKNSEMGLRKLT